MSAATPSEPTHRPHSARFRSRSLATAPRTMTDAPAERPLIAVTYSDPTGTNSSTARERDASEEVSRSFIARAMAAVVGGLATLALSVFARRNLSPADFSYFIVFLSGLFVGPLLARFGSGSRALRELSAYVAADETRHAGTAIRSTVVDNLPFALLFSVLTTVWVAFGSGSSVATLVLVFVSLVTESLRLLLSDVMAALRRTGWAAALGHQLRTLGSVLIYGLVLFSGGGKTVLAFVGSVAASSVLLLIVAVIGIHRAAPIGRWRKPSSLLMSARLGLPFVLVELGLFVIARGDVWLANRYLGAQAANYATASFVAMQLAIPAGLAGHAVSPSVARYWHLGEIGQLRALVLRTQAMLAALLLPAAVAAAALAPMILGIFGDRSNETRRIFLILLIGNALAGSMMLSMNTLLMIGRAWHAATVMLVGVGLYLPIAYLCASRASFAPFAWASTTVSTVVLGALALLCVREFRSAPQMANDS